MRWVMYLLIAIGVIVLGCAGFFALIWQGSSGAVKAAEAYLAAARAGDVTAAQALVVPGFKLAGELTWEEFWRVTGQNDAQDVSFTERHVGTDGARLGGALSLSNGGRVPIRMQWQKRNGQWLIDGLNVGLAAAAYPTPAPEVTTRMFREDLDLLASAAESGDFRRLHERGATVARKAHSEQVLAAMFTPPPGEQAIDWSECRRLLRTIEPTVTRDSERLLVLAATIALAPQPLECRVTYNFEDGQWRPHALRISNDE